MKRAGGELVDERAIHLLVEIEIEAVERAIGIAKARLLVPPLEQPVLSALEFVADERGDEIERRESFGLRLAERGFRGRRPCRRAGVAGGRDRVRRDSCGSPVVRSMRSR